MELQSAKYYTEPEPTPSPVASFAEYIGKEPPPSEDDFLFMAVAIYGAIALMLVSWVASLYAICKIIGVPPNVRGAASAVVYYLGVALDEHCRTAQQQWMVYGIASAFMVAALIFIGCLPINKSSLQSCQRSPVAAIVLLLGDQLRGSGPYAQITAMICLVVGTICSVTGLTWMITLYQNDPRGSYSMIYMSFLAQLGTVACTAGAVSLLRADRESPDAEFVDVGISLPTGVSGSLDPHR